MQHQALMCAAAALLPSICPAGSDNDKANRHKAEKVDIVATAAAAGSFKTLLTAVRTAGLEGVLRGKGPFTVLAPTDAAFAKVPGDLLKSLLEPANRASLRQILTYHVVAGRVDAAAALTAGTARSLEGSPLRASVQAGRLTISGANVMQNDIETTNGLIHAIDRVLIPPTFVAPFKAPTASELIDLAVDRGVPLFNAGQTAACAAIYEVAAASILANGSTDLSAEARTALAGAVQSARRSSHSRTAAWTLRNALDRAYASLRAATPANKPPQRTALSRANSNDTSRAAAPARTDRSVEDFSASSSTRSWRITNDTVMGGRSRSSLRSDGKGTAVFSGTVSLENNGGFASVRRAVDAKTFANSTGVRFRVLGDGKRYRLSVSTRSRATGDSYQAEFATKNGEWSIVELPFAAMKRSIMGWRPKRQKPIDAAKIRSVGFSIGSKQAGEFRLEIDWLGAYSKRDSRTGL